MELARRSLQPWILRLAAFVLFISGGALAQRYLSSETGFQALPLERSQKAQPAVVLLETRKFEVAPSFHHDAIPAPIDSFVPRRQRRFWQRLSSVQSVHPRSPRAFDAQAPPVSN
ncbi:MAG: hypothetical protein HC933_06165 [Pleurocapsa sp. SU_196_0]|nr:hypothetical protein [Pleurocapsa sp. SU_196_0]